MRILFIEEVTTFGDLLLDIKRFKKGQLSFEALIERYSSLEVRILGLAIKWIENNN